METRTGDTVEILVHTSAPSKGLDDARYRALASAYLQFEPARFPEIGVTAGSDWSEVAHQDAQSTAAVGRRHSQLLPAWQDPVNDDLSSGDAPAEDWSYGTSHSPELSSRHNRCQTRSSLRIDSQQASFASVIDNANSPALRDIPDVVRTPPRDSVQAAQDDSWQTPPSVILDSQSTYNKAIPELSSPTKFFELYLQQLGSVDGGSAARAGIHRQPAVAAQQSSSSLPAAIQEPEPASNVSGLLPLVGNQIHDNPPSRDLEAGISSNCHFDTPSRLPRQARTASPADTCLAANTQAASVAPRNSSASRPPISTSPISSSLRKRKRSATSAAANIVSSSSSPTSTNPFASSSEATSSPVPLPPLDKCYTFTAPSNPYQIVPPPPPTSTCILPFDAPLLTPDLCNLATKLNLAARYKPRHQTRLLRPLERGYWLVPAAAWDTRSESNSMRERSWNDLRDFVASGRAGWGVWCTRGPSFHKAVAPKMRTESSAYSSEERELSERGRGEEETGAGDWRVYCWGGIADHVWLLLYLVSQRRLKRSNTEWVDSDGKVVISMI